MLRRLATLALLALPVPAFAEEAPAPAPAPAPETKSAPLPDTIAVPLTEVVNEVAPTPGAPAPAARKGVFVQQPSVLVEFDAGPAEDGAATWTGTMEAGSRKVPFRLRRGTDDVMSLATDRDGDGKVDATKEAVTAKPRPWIMQGNTMGTEWAFEDVRIGGAAVLALVRERAAGFVAQALVPGRENARPQIAPLALTDDPPAAVKNPPKLEGKVRYATGKVRGKDIVAALARGGGDALAFVWAEASSGDLAAGQSVPLTATPNMRGKKRIGTRWQSGPLAYGDGNVVFQLTESLANVMGMVNAPSTRRGTATVNGSEWLAFLLDGDLDGSFTGADDWWWLGPAEAELRPNTSNMTEGQEPRFVADGAWRLKGVEKDGTATFAKATDAPSFEDYVRRRTERVNAKRWFPRFEADTEFAPSRKLDLTRPRAETPAAFHFARTLADAKAIAAKEGKPLLVDFEADWCVWCKRLDYHTYPDREVVEVLSGFTAVKINNELDPEKSFRSMKSPGGEPWTGIPAIGIFDHEGNPLLFRMPGADGTPGRVVDHIPGWMKPEMFVAALRSAMEQWKAVKAGGAQLKLEPVLPAGHPGPPQAPGTPKAPPAGKPPGDVPPPPPPPPPAPEQPK